MKIAITGGIGSGKTTISNMIIDKGFPVYRGCTFYKITIYFL